MNFRENAMRDRELRYGSEERFKLEQLDRILMSTHIQITYLTVNFTEKPSKKVINVRYCKSFCHSMTMVSNKKVCM